jgi:serine/threonine protein kinase
MIDARRGPSSSNDDSLAGHTTPPLPVRVEGADIDDAGEGPRYRGGSLLGAGGMGEVRSVHDRRIGREVAMKLLHRGADTLGTESRRRFLREARVQGQLEHPSIVPVYDLESDPQGETRLFMKRVRGVTLEEVLVALAAGDEEIRRRFPRRRLLTAFVSVCRAVDYAHSRGVIHRDLKPSNIMLGEFGEVHVLDWGIAKVRSAEELAPSRSAGGEELELGATLDAAVLRSSGGSDPTAHGALLGTPGFMSPEQARGDNDHLDARSDVFALGAVLFEVLTLQPLIQGVSARERLEATMRLGEDRSPASRAPRAEVPPELDVACVLSTMPAVEDRTASAGQLAEAVDRFLDGDRDLALREALAEDKVREARAALRDEAAPAEGRARAVRLFARALALDPRHPRASEELGQLLMEAPGELPREAAEELSTMRGEANRRVAVAGLTRVASVVLLAVWGIVLGVRRPGLGALALLGLFGAVAANALWLKARSDRTRTLARLSSALGSVIALTTVSFAFGPVILVPMLAMVNGALLLGQRDFKLDRVIVGVSLVPVLWAFTGNALGLCAPPYEITMDHIVVHAKLVSFPPLATTVLFVLMGCAQIVVPLTVVAALRARLRSVEERLFLHSWHLRRLSAPEG